MKKYFLMAALLCLSAVSMTSCGGDDEDTTNNGNSSYTDQNGNGVLVSQAGPMTFFYDNNNAFDGFMKEGKSYRVANSMMDFSYDMQGEDGVRYMVNEFKMKLNSRGFISQIDFKVRSVDKDSVELRTNGRMVYGYDNNKQLTGTSMKAYITHIAGDGSRVEEGSIDVRHTVHWKNNMLVGFETKTTSSNAITSFNEEDLWINTTEQGEETTTGTFNYGNEKNVTKQMPLGLCDIALDGNGLAMFCIPGLYGTGTTDLPTGATVTSRKFVNGQGSTEEEVYTFDFSINHDGTISAEKVNGESIITYSYTNTRATAEQICHLVKGLQSKLLRKGHTPE